MSKLNTRQRSFLEEKYGYRVNFRKLERKLYGHDIAARIESLPYVRKGKVFAFGIDIDQEEKVVVMMAPPRKGKDEKHAEATPDDFREEIRRFVLREFGLPVHDVHISHNIPKTTSGKMARQRGIQLYLDSVGKP